MKAYKDLDMTQECKDGDTTAVIVPEPDDESIWVQEDPAKRPTVRLLRD